MRYFLRIAFNGSAFHGWQIQQNANTVQAEINRALKVLLKSDTETTGCGRTDTGVHARKFYLHFDTDALIDSAEFLHSLNAILPPSIAAYSVFSVDTTSHARFGATEREYHYHLYFEKDPFKGDRAVYQSRIPDLEAMNKLIPVLMANTDFSCFSKSSTQTFTNNCVIKSAEWKWIGNEMVFRISADRFLRNMVRAIVGTMLEAGYGKLSEAGFKEILESKNRSEAGTSVPAHGLYLTDIHYPFPVN
ncbi:MAG: tRNA pseudouridine(38-40) synthase TruA [Bacteroidia bacterium]